MTTSWRNCCRSAQLALLVAIACFVALTGCASMLPEVVSFGAVSGADANRSLNGLGAHRKMWESAGAKCLTPQKLSPKLETMDVIVLVGQSHGPPGESARDWLEDWLANEEGRTIVYFGRDFNANVYYRQRTLADLPPEDFSRGQQALAEAEGLELRTLTSEVPESTFCRWFYMDTAAERTVVKDFGGPWASIAEKNEGYWPIGVRLLPPESKWRKQKPSWLQKAGGATTPPQTADNSDDATGLVERSEWEVDELASIDRWDSEFRKTARFETLLSSGDGEPLIYRLTARRFDGGQIIVVANGAPLLNGSLVDPLHRAVGKQLIEECLPAQRVALLAYDQTGLLITQAPEADARGAGLEMLMVWPLSGITMPAALLGIVVCAMLLPILGRPQKLARRSVTDFGLHVEAVGKMLVQAGDVEYAKEIIGGYFRKVRGEQPPEWIDAMQVPPRKYPLRSLAPEENPTPTRRGPSRPVPMPPPVTPSPPDTSNRQAGTAAPNANRVNSLLTGQSPLSDVTDNSATNNSGTGQSTAASSPTGDREILPSVTPFNQSAENSAPPSTPEAGQNQSNNETSGTDDLPGPSSNENR